MGGSTSTRSPAPGQAARSRGGTAWTGTRSPRSTGGGRGRRRQEVREGSAFPIRSRRRSARRPSCQDDKMAEISRSCARAAGRAARYSAFTAWCRARDVPFGGRGRPRNRTRGSGTPPGRQLQFDWKEGMRLVDSEGEVFEFSVFTAARLLQEAPVHPRSGAARSTTSSPACSRPSPGWEGCPRCLTDNMSCLVTASGRKRTRQGGLEGSRPGGRLRAQALRRARRRPRAKDGRSANRFLNRLLAYGGEFTGWAGLAEAVARIEAQADSGRTAQPACRPTSCSCGRGEPAAHRQPPAPRVDGGRRQRQTVPPTMLVRAAGGSGPCPGAASAGA